MFRDYYCLVFTKILGPKITSRPVLSSGKASFTNTVPCAGAGAVPAVPRIQTDSEVAGDGRRSGAVVGQDKSKQHRSDQSDANCTKCGANFVE